MASGADQNLAERVVTQMRQQDGFSRWMGIEVESHAPGSCTLTMTVRAEMLNGFGVSHGGIVFALADSAMAFASNGYGEVAVAIDAQASYPAPIKAGDRLRAVASEESATRRLGFYRVEVRNGDGIVVCLFRGTVYRTGKKFFEERA